MTLSVLASAKSASGVDGRARRRVLRPTSPKLGNFARIYLKMPEAECAESDSAKVKSPVVLSPTSGHAVVEGPTSSPLLGKGLTTISDDFARLDIPGYKQATCNASTDDESPARDSPLSAYIASSSRDSTPTTASPVTPCEAGASPKPSIKSLMVGSTPEFYLDNDGDPFNEQVDAFHAQEKHVAFQKLVCPAVAPLKILNPNERHLAQLQRNERIAIAQLCKKPLLSAVAEPLNIPWDMNGDFFPGHFQPTVNSPWAPQKPGYTHVKTVSKNSIDPLYRVDKATQLNILKVKIDERFTEDSTMRSHPEIPQAQEPIHVFVDLSNIVIGYYDCMKAKRGISNNYRVQAPPFFFEAFALVLERYRPCAKRAVVGSLKPASQHPDYMKEAELCGYEMNILQRVSGPKKPRVTNPHAIKRPASGALDEDSDDYGPWCPPMQVAMKHREQGVDEILHLKMVQSILDAPRPGTMVLATGDAAEAEFSDGFLSNVERALERGWNVELVGWRRNISGAWRNQAFQKKWAMGRFRLIELDDLAEELLGFWLRPGQRGSL